MLRLKMGDNVDHKLSEARKTHPLHNLKFS